MSGFIIGLAIGELVSLIIVIGISKGKALEMLGVTAIMWCLAWGLVFLGVGCTYAAGGTLGRAPLAAFVLAAANYGTFRLAEWVDTKYGNPAN